MKTRVVVAMSGGVDSSVAAALLKDQGYDVIGITMCFGLKESLGRKPSCCGLQGIEDARRVCHKLGIKHYVLNFDKFLQDKVIKDFLEEYFCGRTPNPCVRCNQFLKFEYLLKKAKSLDAEYLATGHYARIEFDKEKKSFVLKQAKDKLKDQSYFLYRLNQKQLSCILMPLGGLTKDQVRKIAFDLGLSVANKPGSQEICFVPNDDYREFLRERFKEAAKVVKPGAILDMSGKTIGAHKGIAYYTVGQREGLGIAMGYPIYIVKIDAASNTITASRKNDVMSYGLIAKDLSFTALPMEPARSKARGSLGGILEAGQESISAINGAVFGRGCIKRQLVLKVKIRYNQKAVSSRVVPKGKDWLEVIFSKPQFAVAPGQSVVIYEGQEVIGGGIIESALSRKEAVT